MMTVTVGEPPLSELPSLYRLIQDHAAYERGAATLTPDELEEMLRSRTVRFLSAHLGRGIVGYAAMTFDWSVWRARRYAHLDCLFVSSEHRGNSIGRRLLEKAQTVALSEGGKRMEWQTPAWNEDAARFYLRAGATYQEKSRFILTL